MRTQHTTRGILLLAAAAGALAGGCTHHPETESTPVTPGAASSSKSVTVKDATGKTTADLFRGKFPGVDVTEVPGGIKVRVRNPGGLESFRNNSPDSTGSSRGGGLQGGVPLYVVDGIPVEAVDGALLIDPQSITKIEIVDVAGLALYGIRGANGVVKITTKRK